MNLNYTEFSCESMYPNSFLETSEPSALETTDKAKEQDSVKIKAPEIPDLNVLDNLDLEPVVKPKCPCNGFMSWTQDIRKERSRQYKNTSSFQIQIVLGKEWRDPNFPETLKNYYKIKAKA